ncbi:MAG TPA: hypothetical protein VFT74_09095 [Isosphaeraceae bacterium]|nr:hypothetical protein [Isosphaeraceae bacterium]
MGRKARSDKVKRDDIAVKIERTLVDKARLVAARRGTTLAQYLSDLLRGPVEKDFVKTVRELEGTDK